MRYVQRAQEVLIHDNQSSEQPLGMKLSTENKRHIRETELHEKKSD